MYFEGRNWIELSEYFGISYNDQDNDIVLENTKNYMFSVMFNKDQAYATSRILRLFIERFYQNSQQKADAPLWRRMLEIEDPFTLIKYSSILLEYMSL